MRSLDRQTTKLSPPQALDKLGSVAVGRMFFLHRELPAIRFVNHLLDSGEVIVCASSADIATIAADGLAQAVAYEADDFDDATWTGWSVRITGPVKVVSDPGQAARYRDALRPWVAAEPNDIISINPRLVTGYEVTAAELAEPPLPQWSRVGASAAPGQ